MESSCYTVVSSTRIKPPVYVNHTVHVNLKYAYEQTFAVTGAFEQSADVVMKIKVLSISFSETEILVYLLELNKL